MSVSIRIFWVNCCNCELTMFVIDSATLFPFFFHNWLYDTHWGEHFKAHHFNINCIVCQTFYWYKLPKDNRYITTVYQPKRNILFEFVTPYHMYERSPAVYQDKISTVEPKTTNGLSETMEAKGNDDNNMLV